MCIDSKYEEGWVFVIRKQLENNHSNSKPWLSQGEDCSSKEPKEGSFASIFREGKSWWPDRYLRAPGSLALQLRR